MRPSINVRSVMLVSSSTTEAQGKKLMARLSTTKSPMSPARQSYFQLRGPQGTPSPKLSMTNLTAFLVQIVYLTLLFPQNVTTGSSAIPSVRSVLGVAETSAWHVRVGTIKLTPLTKSLSSPHQRYQKTPLEILRVLLPSHKSFS